MDRRSFFRSMTGASGGVLVAAAKVPMVVAEVPEFGKLPSPTQEPECVCDTRGIQFLTMEMAQYASNIIMEHTRESGFSSRVSFLTHCAREGDFFKSSWTHDRVTFGEHIVARSSIADVNALLAVVRTGTSDGKLAALGPYVRPGAIKIAQRLVHDCMNHSGVMLATLPSPIPGTGVFGSVVANVRAIVSFDPTTLDINATLDVFYGRGERKVKLKFA